MNSLAVKEVKLGQFIETSKIDLSSIILLFGDTVSPENGFNLQAN